MVVHVCIVLTCKLELSNRLCSLAELLKYELLVISDVISFSSTP